MLYLPINLSLIFCSQSKKDVPAVERTVVVTPSNSISHIEIKQEENSRQRILKQGESIMGRAGEMITGLSKKECVLKFHVKLSIIRLDKKLYVFGCACRCRLLCVLFIALVLYDEAGRQAKIDEKIFPKIKVTELIRFALVLLGTS